MKEKYLDFLCCPNCNSSLSLIKTVLSDKKVKEGELICNNNNCKSVYPVTNYVPRFVTFGKYANSFGEQWKTFAKTQLDGKNIKESQIRWNSEVAWNKEDIRGRRIVEFGSGAGRFIDIVSRLEADLVIGVDITDAVDASQSNLGERENVLFIQADFFHIPIREKTMNNAYSIGVLHHTPDPYLAFSKMVNLVQDNGEVALSLYEITLHPRPNRNSLKVATIDLLWAINLWRCEFYRSITTRIPDQLFLNYCKYFVPVLHYINKIPILGYVRYLFPSTCYKSLPVEWSMVDTNDTYATEIVHQYRHKDLFQWFLRQKLNNIIVHNGRAGWVSLTGTKHNNVINQEKYVTEAPKQPGL